jgi:hypothetical protein
MNGPDKEYSLGPYRQTSPKWYHHDVVVKDDRVYDGFTGERGEPLEEYRKHWTYDDVLRWDPQ